MRWILILMALASCGARTLEDVRSTGLQTTPVESTRAARDVTACLTPLYDRVIDNIPAQMRMTPTGFELVEMGGMYNAWVSSIITIAENNGGATIIVIVPNHLRIRDKRMRQLNAIIAQCA